ncbi:hypothetical protein FHETE_247 [Fusarium heterosporum]|uniref:Uncharacterized protein n=1 Tax=Fusarium heterosporum TaxID=42747 RepID=A0A8H5TYT5_FUSHE|nr:hypothetical protein FHETE_247 [Fusarium heterosporum]
MLNPAQLAQIDQKVAILMREHDHCFGASFREGIEDSSSSSADGTKIASTNATERALETKAPQLWSDWYSNLDPELASYAAALDNHIFMSTFGPSSKVEASMSSSYPVTDHPKTDSSPNLTINIIPPSAANKRSFVKVSSKYQTNVNAQQK